MTWLTGKPTRTRAISWPENDAEIAKVGTTEAREGQSISANKILYWVASTGGEKTVLYVADIDKLSTLEDEVVLQRAAQLDYSVHRAALTVDGGFVCVKWDDSEGNVIVRHHSPDGTQLGEESVEAEAAYGNLVVHGAWVALCIASGEESDDIIPTDKRFRIDWSIDADTSAFPMSQVADEIWMWNVDDGSSERVKIPQNPDAPMLHEGIFQIVGDYIVLAGSVEDDERAAIISFSWRQPEAQPVAFVEPQLTNPEGVERSVMTDPNSGDILVHCHESGSRITVYKSGLLLGSIPSTGTSEDPPGLCESYLHPNDARTLPFSVANTLNLPSVSNNRILVKSSSFPAPPIFHILDFDQARLGELISMTHEQRASLEQQLQSAGGHVQVVTRRYNWSDADGMVDGEYPTRADATEQWKEYLMAAPSPLDVTQALEFDEPPEDKREPMPWGFVRTVLDLGKDVDGMYLALVGSSVVEMPTARKAGWIFNFE
ncbi:hypothetical protein CVT24_007311 [Panaeolus cyanescens]|uniref:Uncharacterized protein n=1 Tax=Panaeolus cyanescens TaxID=181874 RepID=A0A409YPK5_9AGAR|nr:hypothetical protein CVT24_007311 [Panaeolus cyanescens]